MSAGPADGAYAVDLLIAEAWAAAHEARYGVAAAAAERAVTGAERTGDVVLLVRALNVRAEASRMSGDMGAALVDFTRILGLAEDPGIAGRLGEDRAARAVAAAYMWWADSARFRGGVPLRDLFAVLDAGERWLTATGRPHWRSGLLLQRALLHRWLGEHQAAIAFAEEALAAYRPGAPGPPPPALRYAIGDELREAGQHTEAVPYYEATLDDPDASSYVRMNAHRGLARCAIAGRDDDAALRHAAAAVRLAEGMTDPALSATLETSVAASRASGKLDAAWEAAIRHRAAAERVGGHYRLYYAVRDVVDVALDRADVDTARRLLAELDGHAAAVDGDTGTGDRTAETAQRHARLAKLTPDTP